MHKEQGSAKTKPAKHWIEHGDRVITAGKAMRHADGMRIFALHHDTSSHYDLTNAECLQVWDTFGGG